MISPRIYAGLIRALSKHLGVDQLIERVARLKLSDAQAAAALIAAADLPRDVEVDPRPLRECIARVRFEAARRVFADDTLEPEVGESGPCMRERTT